MKRIHDFTKEDWEAMDLLTDEQRKTIWDNERQFDLEEDFQEFMNTPFESLRSKYHYRKYNREEAIKIQKMLEERLGVPDPEGEIPDEGWRQSNWCSE